MEGIDFRETPLAVAISGNAGAGKSTVSVAAAQAAQADTVFNTGRIYRTAVRIMQSYGIYADNELAIQSFAASVEDVRQQGFGDDQLTIFSFRDGSEIAKHPIKDSLHAPEMTPILPGYTSHLPLRKRLGDVEVGTASRVLNGGWPVSHSRVFVSEGRDVYDVLTGGGIPEEQVLSIFLGVSDETAAKRRQHEPAFEGMNLKQIQDEIAERNRKDTQRAHGSYAYKPGRDILIDTDDTSAPEVAAKIIELIYDRVA